MTNRYVKKKSGITSLVMKLVSLHSKKEKDARVRYLPLSSIYIQQPSLIHMMEHPLTLNNIRLTSGCYSWKLAFSIPRTNTP